MHLRQAKEVAIRNHKSNELVVNKEDIKHAILDYCKYNLQKNETNLKYI